MIEKELVIEKLDGSTIRRRYESWESFKKEDLLKLQEDLINELTKIDALLLEFDK